MLRSQGSDMGTSQLRIFLSSISAFTLQYDGAGTFPVLILGDVLAQRGNPGGYRQESDFEA